MSRNTIYGFLLLLAMVLIGVGLYLYNKPRPSMEQQSAAYTVKAMDWIEEYTADENAANQKYLGNVIEVEGEIQEVQMEKTPMLILTGNGMNSVQCVFPEGYSFDPEVKPEASITVKGMCNGMLLDIILTECMIVSSVPEEK
ncbi:hypothetical protein AAG747_23660 [Rapidithrix thailandica]|uniref:tRNA_anti-like n=1 Tax=Rapidithrix thailandica TaxID=413964 RepID=A0AAW9SI32_9BACT